MPKPLQPNKYLFKKSPVIKEYLSDFNDHILIMAKFRCPLLKRWQ